MASAAACNARLRSSLEDIARAAAARRAASPIGCIMSAITADEVSLVFIIKQYQFIPVNHDRSTTVAELFFYMFRLTPDQSPGLII